MSLNLCFPNSATGASSGFLGGAVVKKSACQRRRHRRLKFDPLEEEMATRSSILAWKIPWTDFTGGLVAKTLSSQCRGPRFISFSGN